MSSFATVVRALQIKIINKRKLNNPCVSSFDIFLLVCRSAVLEPTTVNFPSLCVSESRPVKIQSLEANICYWGPNRDPIKAALGMYTALSGIGPLSH